MTKKSDEELLEDLRRVEKKIGKSPTCEEYRTYGNYSYTTYYRRFGGWNDAKAAAGLSQYAKTEDFAITEKELLEDLRHVARKIGKSPTKKEYRLHGEYDPDTIGNRFDGWNSAKDIIGLHRNKDFDITDEDLLKDLKRVAKKINRSPTVVEYRNEGDYSAHIFDSRFDGWNSAKDAAGLSRNTDHDYSNEDLLKHIRKEAVNTEISNLEEFFLGLDKQAGKHRYGSYWKQIVRSGVKPTTHAPLSEEEYDSYIQTAINADHPSISLYGLLRAFTGMPSTVLEEFNLDWVSRIDSEFQPPLVRVPSKHISVDDDWELILPEHYTTGSGDKKTTQIKSLLQWMDDTDSLQVSPAKGETFSPTIIINRADLNATSRNLRGTVAAHLARQGISRFKIDMQVGASKTNWKRSVEDYLLYLYQFEGYCHPDYEPSGTYLDPKTGKVTKI